MSNLKQINIKHCPNYFFNSMTNIKNLDSNLLGINQITFTKTDSVVYEIEYFEYLDGVNSFYLVFNDADAYFEFIDENKYLVFALTGKNREALENYKELWSEIKDPIELISSNKPIEYKKDFMKIKFKLDDDFPLGKILNIPVCVIIAKSVFQTKRQILPTSMAMNIKMIHIWLVKILQFASCVNPPDFPIH